MRYAAGHSVRWDYETFSRLGVRASLGTSWTYKLIQLIAFHILPPMFINQASKHHGM
jgi:hypothetical protein